MRKFYILLSIFSAIAVAYSFFGIIQASSMSEVPGENHSVISFNFWIIVAVIFSVVLITSLVKRFSFSK